MIISRNFISLRKRRTIDSRWRSLGSLSISAVTTAPTKATSPYRDAAFCRRSGDTLEYWGEYIHTDNAGAAAGSGIYLFPLPFGLTADTNKIFVSTANCGSVAGWAVGKGAAAAAKYPAGGNVWLYDSQNLAMSLCDPGVSDGPNTVASTYAPMSSADVFYSFYAWVPVQSWGIRKI